MDDFFLDAAKTTYPCASVDDLKHQLEGLRLEKVTDKTAKHISATFEFRPTAVFTIPETDSDQDGASPIQNLDPALDGGAAASAANASESNDTTPNQTPSVATRVIRAHDTLINQPADNPVLQKAVARHILANLGSVDNSSWVVRSVSRNSVGWSFQYVCRNSIQEWKRQNAKYAATMLVAKSSGKDGQDAIAAARPAFNCRGSVTVSFSKNGRTIKVRLEHTPIHRTVAELAELYKPPPPPPPRVDTVKIQDKVGKKRKSEAADGVEGADRPRKKRKDKTASPDDPTASGTQTPKIKKLRVSKSKKVGAQKDDVGNQPPALLTLCPSEAARRREEATRKLSESGIDPSTLSSEQFDTFANQSPDLQIESLAMFVKYGAKRLRIVHPDKGNASSARPPPANATPKGSAKKKSKKSQLNPDGTPKVKRTRGSCQSCRTNKTKCNKAKPECGQCVESGIACFYPLERKRGAQQTEGLDENAATQPDTTIVDQTPEQKQDEEAEAEPEAESAAEAVPVAKKVAPEADPSPEDDDASDLGSPGFYNSYIPEPAQTQATTETVPEYADVPHNLYPPAHTNASYPQTVADEAPSGVDYSVYPIEPVQSQNDMVYSYQAQPTSQVNYPDLLNTPPTQAAVPTPVQPVQPPAPITHSTPTQSSNRRSLPNKSTRSRHAYSNSASTNNSNNPSDWQTDAVSANTANTSSNHTLRGGRPDNTNTSTTHDNNPRQRDHIQAALTLSEAALQRSDPVPATRTVSPFQHSAQAAKARSAQNQRSQGRRQLTSPFQQASTTRAGLAQTAAMYATANSASTNSVSSYDQQHHYTDAVTNQRSQTSSADIREPYTLQNGHDKTTASYLNYDAYTTRPQSAVTSSLAAPLSHGTSSPTTLPPASNSVVWPTPGGMDSDPYRGSKAAAPATSVYSSQQHNMRTTQQQYDSPQQAQMTQDNNPRRRSNAHVSSASTSSSSTYGTKDQTRSTHQRQQAQQQQTPQQAYNQYAAQQSHHSSSQQQQQQQNNWFGMRSMDHNNSAYGSNTQHAKQYSHPGPNATASYSQHNAMDLSGNTYQHLDQQELYEMFRNNPTH